MDPSLDKSCVLTAAGAMDADQVLSLYQSVIGSEFCTWNKEYPGIHEIRDDYESGNLFVIRRDKEIIGAISIVPDNELDDLEFWTVKTGKIAEIARVAVAPEQQGRGLALKMVNEIEGILKDRGYRAAHLLAAVVNIPACHTYRKTGYNLLGECDMFGHRFYAFEKELSIDTEGAG